jgi:molecular chaperone HtpG
VLGQHLYSTPNVAVRELVQNAHDALSRRRIEAADWQEPTQNEGRIYVWGEDGFLHIQDNGSGLTEGEIHQYLATVGVGYTRRLRESGAAPDLIGLFGLGFLSCFMLATQVQVRTTSYQNPSQTWLYESKNGQHYQVRALPNVSPNAEAVGTTVTLELRAEYQHLTDILTRILVHYCRLLPEKVFIGHPDRQPLALNDQRPPWRDAALLEAPEVRRLQQELKFAESIEQSFAPMATIRVEHPQLQGLLWIQEGASYASSDNRDLKVYVRGMLLDDDARDLLPAWAGFISGVIESHALTPTASREDLQRDTAYKEAKKALLEALMQGFLHLARSQPMAWQKVLERHNEALMGASLSEPALFDLIADRIRIPTSQGDKTVAVLQRSGPIYLALNVSGSFEETFFRALQCPVARGDRYGVAAFLRRWIEKNGGKLVEIGGQNDSALFTPTTVSPAQQAKALLLQDAGESLCFSRFHPEHLPMVRVIDALAELKKRLETPAPRMGAAALGLARKHVDKIDTGPALKLHLNLNNPAIQAFLDSPEDRPSAVVFLKALKTVLCPSDDTSGQFPLALETFTQTALGLLG